MPYIKQKPKSEWFCKEPNCNAPTKGYGDFCLKCVAKHRGMSGIDNPNYKDGRYTKKCVICNKKITAKDRDTCEAHTWAKVEYIERCDDCGEITKGYGVRCPRCNNIITTSAPDFKLACKERMNKRYENPAERIKQSEKTKVGVDISRLTHPERWIRPKGKDSHLYINGESLRGYIGFTETLKQEVRERDGYKCQLCGIDNDEHLLIYDRSLACHHVDYNKEHSTKDNLISLCVQCHARTNIDRATWQSYFQTNFAQHLAQEVLI